MASERDARLADPRTIVLVGGGIAAISGVVLLASLFVPWYREPVLCLAPCLEAGRSGWSALGIASVVLALAAIAAALPLVGMLLAPARASPLTALAVVAGLGAALLIVFRIAVPPGEVLAPARLAGPFTALLGAMGVAAGSVLAGIRERIFEPVRRPALPLVVIVLASVVMMASLLLPWVRRAEAPIGLTLQPLGGLVQSAWTASTTLAVLLLLGALALACASGLVAVIRWRAAFFALAVGGWIVAAIVVAATPLVVPLPSVGPPAARLIAYEPGYYVCLGSAAAIVVTGVAAAVIGA